MATKLGPPNMRVQRTRRAWADPTAWNSLAFGSISLLILSYGLEVLAFLWLGVA